jgi:type IV secretory pathway VirB10-like protein
MRKTESKGLMIRKSLTSARALRLAAVALGVGLLMASGAARAQQDDEDDDKTFEEKVIDGIMRGIGATNMENKGIDYRERSPLVVPPKLDLPPPASTAEAKAPPNWPKDPDEARRKAAIEARKKEKKQDPAEAARPLSPDELNSVRTRPTKSAESNDSLKPGDTNARPLSPHELGFDGKFSDLFGSSKPETTPFKGEPTRDSLVQPPAGYQTPSPNFAYGTGPKESLNKPYDPARGQYGE